MVSGLARRYRWSAETTDLNARSPIPMRDFFDAGTSRIRPAQLGNKKSDISHSAGRCLTRFKPRNIGYKKYSLGWKIDGMDCVNAVSLYKLPRP
jgi:hypothetical protein